MSHGRVVSASDFFDCLVLASAVVGLLSMLFLAWFVQRGPRW